MNIVILTLGRSGSSIVTKMLEQLGWKLCGADRIYMENVRFRSLNERLLHGQYRLSGDDVVAFLESLHEPWVLKDPRFTRTWKFWKRHLDCGETMLLYLTRNLEDVEASLRKKGWGMSSPDGWLLLRGHTLPEADRECRRCYERWKGPKVQIAYEGIHRAIRLFDLSRGSIK